MPQKGLKVGLLSVIVAFPGLTHLFLLSRLYPGPKVINRGSYMRAHVLLNLLNKLGKRDKNARLPEHFISFSQRV